MTRGVFIVIAEPSPTSAQLLPDDPAVVELVGRASAARDQAAFGELYDRFLDPVYRYLYYRTGSVIEAEDLTEQVFLKAWTAIQRFRWQGKPFQAWLYTLAHNLLVDHRRRARPITSLDDGDRAMDVESESATRELTQWIDAELLASAVSQLTSDQQQVIVLKFIDGFDTARIAELLDKQEGTVRALQMRALRSLRRVLEQQGIRGAA